MRGKPWIPAAVVALAAAAFVALRLAFAGADNISRFVMAERPFAQPGLVPRGLAILPGNGYDGQFFYRLALNPSNLHPTAYGITLDTPFRLQRIGYPVLAWLGSFGRHSWVPGSLVVVNLAALIALGFLGGLIARDARRHVLWGVLLAGYFGFVFSLARDTAEPVAAAFLIAGLLASRRGRPVAAGVLLAYGALTRETVMVVVGAIAIVRFLDVARRRARPGRHDLAWVIPVVAFAGWQLVVRDVVGVYPIRSDATSNSGHPFDAVVGAIGHHLRAVSIHHAAVDIWVIQFAVLVVFVVAALASLGSTSAPLTERVAFGLFLVELTVLSPNIWNGVADLRSLDEVYLLAVLILLGSPRPTLKVPVTALAPALLVTAAHRIASL